MGIEPTCEAWKASALPLSYTRKTGRSGEIRTRDPLVPNQVRYRCATPRCAPLSIAHGGFRPQRAAARRHQVRAPAQTVQDRVSCDARIVLRSTASLSRRDALPGELHILPRVRAADHACRSAVGIRPRRRGGRPKPIGRAGAVRGRRPPASRPTSSQSRELRLAQGGEAQLTADWPVLDRKSADTDQPFTCPAVTDRARWCARGGGAASTAATRCLARAAARGRSRRLQRAGCARLAAS